MGTDRKEVGSRLVEMAKARLEASMRELENPSRFEEDIREIRSLFPDADFKLDPLGVSRSVEGFHRTKRKREEFLEQRSKDPYVFLRNAGVPYRFRNATKDSVAPGVWACLAGEHSAYIFGGAGTGKTYLAASWIRSFLDDHDPVITMERRNVDMVHRYYDFTIPSFGSYNLPKFISVPDLLLYIRGTFGSQSGATEQEIIDECTGQQPIVLDDLGAEKTSEWSLQTLYTIIDRRYRDEHRTIITSNLSLENLGEKLGDRITSRIAGMCKVIELKGNDRRLAG